jgi:hypothetical protein
MNQVAALLHYDVRARRFLRDDDGFIRRKTFRLDLYGAEKAAPSNLIVAGPATDGSGKLTEFMKPGAALRLFVAPFLITLRVPPLTLPNRLLISATSSVPTATSSDGIMAP